MLAFILRKQLFSLLSPHQKVIVRKPFWTSPSLLSMALLLRKNGICQNIAGMGTMSFVTGSTLTFLPYLKNSQLYAVQDCREYI